MTYGIAVQEFDKELDNGLDGSDWAQPGRASSVLLHYITGDHPKGH